MYGSLLKGVIEEFNGRYKLGISSFMKLEEIDKKLNEDEKKYQAFLNFVKGFYNNEHFYESVSKVGKEKLMLELKK